MLKVLRFANLALRGLMELGIVVALAYWGYRTGHSSSQKILFGICTPALIFSFWALVDFRKAATPEFFRLMQELILSILAAMAWYTAGQHALGWTLGIVSIVHHVAVYPLGERLLK